MRIEVRIVIEEGDAEREAPALLSVLGKLQALVDDGKSPDDGEDFVDEPGGNPAPAPEPEPKPASKKAASKKKSSRKKAASKSKPAATEKDPASPEPTLADVAKATQTAMRKKGQGHVRELLDRFQIASVTDLPGDQRESWIEACVSP